MNAISPCRSTILVMHDDPLLCTGLVTALRQHAGFEVYQADADQLCPAIDVVITDYAGAMRLSGAAARAAHRPIAEAKILALTANDREGDIRRAIEAGIHGYVLVGGTLDELTAGVKAVASGTRFLCRCVAQRMADSLAHAALTAREKDVLRLVAAGEPNKSIARRLHIEVGTVKTHVSAIMTKLGASSRTQAAGIAVSRGLVEDLDHSTGTPPPPRFALAAPRAQLM